jgi:hypothetical protein
MQEGVPALRFGWLELPDHLPVSSHLDHATRRATIGVAHCFNSQAVESSRCFRATLRAKAGSSGAGTIQGLSLLLVGFSIPEWRELVWSLHQAAGIAMWRGLRLPLWANTLLTVVFLVVIAAEVDLLWVAST